MGHGLMRIPAKRQTPKEINSRKSFKVAGGKKVFSSGESPVNRSFTSTRKLDTLEKVRRTVARPRKGELPWTNK